MAIGVCKLTGSRGQFVDAHIIPKALTRPAVRGQPFQQLGSGLRPLRRWDSWYDRRLVTGAGEEHLAALDTWGIAELRKHKLVWSGWDGRRDLREYHTAIGETPWGMRKIDGIDGDQLKVFLLSLLWRAAASQRPEFSGINMPEDDLELMRRVVLREAECPRSFYPIQPTQLSTIGPIHNHTPIAQTKKIPAIGDLPARVAPVFRFYFDGFIVHFHRPPVTDTEAQQIGNLWVGNAHDLLVSTVTYEMSFQRKNLETVPAESL